MRFILTSAFAISFLSQSAGAQGEVSVQFVSFPKAQDPLPVELVVGDGKTIPVDLPTNRLSPVYKVGSLSKWVLGETTTNAEGEATFNVFGSADSIAESKQLILVIRKGKGNADGFLLIPMANSSAKLGGGSYFMLNASTADVMGTLSDKKFGLKPGKFTSLKPAPSRVKGVYEYCDVSLYYLREKTPRQFFTSTWRLSDHARSFIIFYNDPETNKLRFHSIRDYVKP